MPNSKPRVHKRSSSGEAMCGRGGAHPRLTAYTDEVTCTYCALGVTGISGHPEAHAEAKRAQPAAPDFPGTIPAAPEDDPSRPWRVMDEPGNTLDCPDRASARQVMEDQLVSSALYSRNMVSGEWSQYETLLRGRPMTPTLVCETCREPVERTSDDDFQHASTDDGLTCTAWPVVPADRAREAGRKRAEQLFAASADENWLGI